MSKAKTQQADVKDAIETLSRFRVRVKELVHVPASELVAHPMNPRIHDDRQRAHVRALLRQVGFANALLAYRDEAGQLCLIDGHLRKDLADDQLVPVLVTDLTKQEADTMIAAMDQVAGMAKLDDTLMSDLIGSLQFDDADMRRLLDDLSTLVGKNKGDHEPGQPGTNDGSEHEHAVDELLLKPHEHYDYIVILASDVGTWNVLCEKLGIVNQPLFGRKKSRLGICRAIKAEEVLKRVSHSYAEPQAAPRG